MADALQHKGPNNVAVASPLPRYQVIANHLQQQRERLTGPEKLPSEEALAVEHKVARDTVRRAMRVLEIRGAVTRRRGRGTFLLPEETAPREQAGLGVGFVPPWWADSMQAWYTARVPESRATHRMPRTPPKSASWPWLGMLGPSRRRCPPGST